MHDRYDTVAVEEEASEDGEMSSAMGLTPFPTVDIGVGKASYAVDSKLLVQIVGYVFGSYIRDLSETKQPKSSASSIR